MTDLEAQRPEALRRAALTLHALAVEDKEWLLNCLPASQADALKLLLNELQQLGIPKDSALVQSVLAASRSKEGLDASQAKAMCRVLSSEPAAMQSQLLSLLAPELRADILRIWPTELLRPTPSAPPASWGSAVQQALRQALQDATVQESVA